jgi:hypothetical protein
MQEDDTGVVVELSDGQSPGAKSTEGPQLA